MTHEFIHACAGAGKTERIVHRCSMNDKKANRLVITLTTSGQDELISRLSSACSPENIPDVIGWYTFLIHHYVRPYLPKLFPNIEPTGFIFDRNAHPSNLMRKRGSQRYFSADGSLFKETLPELAIKIAEIANPLVEQRLSQIYDEIIIDEVQDISRKSLDIIHRLLSQNSIKLIMVGDTRQSLIDSDQMSRKNRGADRLELMNWYREHQKHGRIQITELSETWRSNSAIAEFSDRIFPEELHFAHTKSVNSSNTGHDGVFFVHERDLRSYLTKFKPTALRPSISVGKHLNHIDFQNIGRVKGFTFDRVIIFPTQPMIDFITKGDRLKDKSACLFYVGVTRARHSVAIIISDNIRKKTHLDNLYIPITIWNPENA